MLDTLRPGDLPPSETFFMWKEYGLVDGEKTPQLLTPWSDPAEYEFAMDWMFQTPEEAKVAKAEHAPDEDWVLVRMMCQPVEIVVGAEVEEE